VLEFEPGEGEGVGRRLGAGVGMTLPPLIEPVTATPLQ
jgi:hypothetical protein